MCVVHVKKNPLYIVYESMYITKILLIQVAVAVHYCVVLPCD